MGGIVVVAVGDVDNNNNNDNRTIDVHGVSFYDDDTMLLDPISSVTVQHDARLVEASKFVDSVQFGHR